MQKILWLLPLVLVLLSANAHAVDLTTCTTITEPGYYRLVNDISTDVSRCFFIRSSNVTFDCDGHVLHATGLYTLLIYFQPITWGNYLTNITIKNCIFDNDDYYNARINGYWLRDSTFLNNTYIRKIGSELSYLVNVSFINTNMETSIYHSSTIYVREITANSTHYFRLKANTVSNIIVDNYYANGSNVNLFQVFRDVGTTNLIINNSYFKINQSPLLITSGRANLAIYNTKIGVVEGGFADKLFRISSYLDTSWGVFKSYIDIVNSSINASDVVIYLLSTNDNTKKTGIYQLNITNSKVKFKRLVLFDTSRTYDPYIRHVDIVNSSLNCISDNSYAISGPMRDVEIMYSNIRDCTYAVDLTSIFNLTITHSKITSSYYGIFIGPDKVSGQNVVIYDNLFNNTYNHMFQAYPVANDVYIFNTTLVNSTNILGGNLVGGNYWGSPDGSGYSDMCIDEDQDGICDAPYVIVDDPEAGVYLVDYLPLSPYQVQPFAPPQLPEVRILNPVSEVYYSAYVPVDVVVVYNQSRYDIESNISVYVDGLAYGRCTNCTELHKTIYVGGGEHVFEVYVPYKLYENGSLVNDSVLYANSTFFVQFVPLQTQITGAPGGGAGAVLSLVDVEVRDASYITYQNECVKDYLIVDLKNAFDYCDVEIMYYGEGLPEGMIKYPSEYTLKPGVTYIPIEVCGVAQPDVYVGKVKVEGLCGSDIGDVSVTVKSQFSQLWEFITSPIGILLVLVGLWLWKGRKG